MTMETNLAGRLRNTALPMSGGLLPLFEAVANSIHAIEEAELSPSEGRISIEIVRDSQGILPFPEGKKKRGPEPKGDIVGFKTVDNGVGFNDANMKSFQTLDSDYKTNKGGRGVGRLLWLKAFRQAQVTSTFFDKGNTNKSRTFLFSAPSGVHGESIDGVENNERLTCVHLDGFEERYREASPKTAESIANSLLEHCLWYFVREGGAPKISLADGGSYIDLDDVYEQHMVSPAATETIEIKGVDFELIHIKLRAHTSRPHMIAFCAANRVVQEENLKGKIPGLFGSLTDDHGTFVYECYVSSSFLDDRVRSERTGFDIDEKPLALFADTEISLEDIRVEVTAKAADHLSEDLEDNKRLGKERLESFVTNQGPRYRPILGRIPEEKLIVDPAISDKELELTLHKHLAEIEAQVLAAGHDVINPKGDEGFPEYQKRLQEFLRAAEDIKKSDLANYVSHRRVILEILEKAIQRGEDGRYVREDLIHNLIMPMRNDSNEVMPDSCNLWLLDERLAFHDYLGSDKTLSSMPICDSKETKEPDLVALNVFDNPILVSEGTKLPLASIVVFEIKRPMRNDAAQGEEKDPIEQALGYLERIRAGKVKTASGRPIPNSEDTPGFCYAICDITPSVKHRCKVLGLTPTSDHMGYFGYNTNFKAYLEVISYDRLVNAAKERNRAFFDKLGLPTT